MAAEDESAMRLYRELAGRCRQLEATQDMLREELDELEQGKRKSAATATRGCDRLPVIFLAGSPYRRVLDALGNAVHVTSGTIIFFWNRAAEKIYGWTCYEALGQRDTDMLVVEGYHEPLSRIEDDILSTGCSWSGQLPMRKRSGEVFKALVTKSRMIEDGEFLGLVTVSSSAAVFNRLNGIEVWLPYSSGGGRGKKPTNERKIQCHPPFPQISASVSNLASRLLTGQQGNETCSTSWNPTERRNAASNSEAAPEKLNLATKVLAKLDIWETAGNEETMNRKFRNDNYMTGSSMHGSEASKLGDEKYAAGATMSCNGRYKLVGGDYSGNRYEYQVSCSDLAQGVRNTEVLQFGDNVQNVERKPRSVAGLVSSSQSSSSGRADNDLDAIVDCEVKWVDLQLREEIGHGSFAVVYRGSWIGSDVAVKVYSQNWSFESTLEDHRKEILIMMKLRHPNVLLFMGAVYSPERPAIVTEFMPRGSLFKILHKSNQALDTKRRLKMALDVARGMNYLHCRNPPLVHCDLKSSNLLVERNWTVKVGDFGLSRWKEATFLNTKSGKGTPQWMAPEVLRRDPWNEKSDVFSFGVVLWELVTVSIPWSHLNSMQVVGAVGFMDRRLELPEGIDPQVASIIHDCWHSELQQRPSFGDIIHRMCNVVQKGGPGSGRRRLLEA